MTPEEIEVLKQMTWLIEQQAEKIIALAAAQGALIGMMQAKELLNANEVEGLFDFIEHSLPDGQSGSGMETLQAIETVSSAVLRSAEPG